MSDDLNLRWRDIVFMTLFDGMMLYLPWADSAIPIAADITPYRKKQLIYQMGYCYKTLNGKIKKLQPGKRVVYNAFTLKF